MKYLRNILLVFILTIVSNSWGQDYVSLYLQNKITLQSLVLEFSSRSKYNELYEILDNILKITNVYEVRLEKIKVGYPLGKNILEDLYLVMGTNIFERYIYLPIFSIPTLVSNFSEYLLRLEKPNDIVLKSFSKVCLINNHLEPMLFLVKKGIITNNLILSDLIEKLFNFRMFSEIRDIFYTFKDKVEWDINTLLNIGRALGELGDEESLKILSSDNYVFIPYRIEFLIRFGYIEEGIEEVRNYGISPRNAKYVFLAFLNTTNFTDAKVCLSYLPTDFREYFSCVLDIFLGKNILDIEKRLKNLLLKQDISPEVKNQIGFILWIINTSSDKKTMNEEIIFCLNYLNNIKSNRFYSERVYQKIKISNL